MYICLDCENIFEAPRLYTEPHGLDYGREKWRGCPVCAGAYVKAQQCDICGEYIKGDYIKTSDCQIICDMCYQACSVKRQA